MRDAAGCLARLAEAAAAPSTGGADAGGAGAPDGPAGLLAAALGGGAGAQGRRWGLSAWWLRLGAHCCAAGLPCSPGTQAQRCESNLPDPLPTTCLSRPPLHTGALLEPVPAPEPVVCQLVLSCRVLEATAGLLAGLGLAAAQAKAAAAGAAGAEAATANRQSAQYAALQHELLLALRPLLLQLLAGSPAYAGLLQQPAPLAALAAALGGGGQQGAAGAAGKQGGLAAEVAEVLRCTLVAMR